MVVTEALLQGAQKGVQSLLSGAQKTHTPPPDESLTLESVAEAVLWIEKRVESNETAVLEIISTCEGIMEELNGLAPQNVNSRLSEIRDWMQRHVASEETALNAIKENHKAELLALRQKQTYWNAALLCGVVISIFLAIYRVH